jgi:5-methylthioadenosine/S-adenosylhomocysteine deaminase
LIEKISAHAGERNTGIHAHLCEHRNEVSFCLERYQMRPAAFLDRCGLLGPRLVTAHNVALSEHDITLLTDRKVKMIHCPYANLINHGFPKTPRILEAGGCVGLGSDGAAYNSVDLFEEMRTLRAALISSSGLPVFDPEVMPVKTMLKMATQNGAAALGMEDCLGKVEEGCIADLITIDIRKPHIYPTNNYTTALVDTVTAQDVCDSIIDGQIVMEDRKLKTIDEQAVMEECRIRLTSINGRL